MRQRGYVYFLANEASPLERHLYVDVARHPHPPTRRGASRAKRAGTTRSCCPGARGYLDLCSSPDQPPTASLRKLDGSRAALAGAQRARRDASVSRVRRESHQGRVRLDHRKRRPAALLPPVEAGGHAGRQALSGRRRHLRRAAHPVCAQGLDGRRARGAGLLPTGARAARLRRVHARQSRLGFPRQRVRDPRSRSARQGRNRGSAARRRVPEDASRSSIRSASASWAGATAAT